MNQGLPRAAPDTLFTYVFLYPGTEEASKWSVTKEAVCGPDSNIPEFRHCWEKVRVAAWPGRKQECTQAGWSLQT